MTHDAGRACLCSANHQPYPLEFERHHIWPLGMGGPEDDTNVTWVCPTAHANAHELLRIFMREGPLSWTAIGERYDVPVSRYAYALALDGYRRWRAGSVLTP